MHCTSITVPTAAPAAVANTTRESTSTSTSPTAVPVNHNGPQCCHCGWRGGEHASNCPFK
ncbi:hypothetical protein C8R44DRAFT_886532 [Mycena epipterygia]|nr:hypothetical protein C8R44DRAFT_886532 [Mycena epipterygia]